MQTAITRDHALEELRRTVTYLIIEKRKGREEIALDFLLDQAVETNILRNFNGVIEADDYEDLVRELFGRGDELFLGAFDPREIAQEVTRLIAAKIRNPQEITDKIFTQFNIAPDDRQDAANIVLRAYQVQALQELRNLVTLSLRNGESDDKRLARQAQTLGFDLSPAEILKEVKRVKRVLREEESQEMKSRLVQRRQRRPGPVVEEQHGASSAAKKLFIERRRKAIAESLQQGKIRFVQTHCDPVEFALLENMSKDDKRVFIHRAMAREGLEIFVQTIAGLGSIENVLVELRKVSGGKRQRLRLDVADMHRYATSPEGLKVFSKQLQQASKVMEWNNIQETLWFLSNILLRKKGLPLKGAEFIKDHLLTHLQELDNTLFHHAVAKAIEKI